MVCRSAVVAQREQGAQFLFGDPGGQQIPGRVEVDAGVPHCREPFAGQAFPGAQQVAAVDPHRVTAAAAAAQVGAGDPLPHGGYGPVRGKDEVEVVHRDAGMRQQLANRGGVRGARVDGHDLYRVPPDLAALGQPGPHGGAGAPVDLAQQRMRSGQVNKAGLPRIDSHHRPSASRRHRGRPNRVSSIPNHRVGGGSPNTVAHRRVNARCTVGQDTRCDRATSATERFSPTASATAVRSRIVVRPPGGTAGT